jgi:zinc protease
MVLVVSGDLDPKAVKEKIAGLFGKLNKQPPKKIEPAREKKKPQPRILTRTALKEQSVIMLGYLGAQSYSHDKYVLNVLASVLSGVNGRLSKSVREQKGLAYVLNAVSLHGLERGMFIFYIGTSKENLEAAKNELFKEISLIKRDGIMGKELADAKKELIGSHRIWLQKIQDVASRAATDEACGADYLNYTKFEDRINHITKECVLRAARKYLDDHSYVLLTIKGK